MELKQSKATTFVIMFIAFNRTNMELKQILTFFADELQKTFNRTNMELKLVRRDQTHVSKDSFNRTNMELKQRCA